MKLSNSYQLRNPNQYVKALLSHYSFWAFDEQRALRMRGKWRTHLGFPQITPLDIEIGLGNGLHYAYRAKNHPDRLLLGFELKYKPLIQSVKRVLREGCRNALAIRYHAHDLWEIFNLRDIDNVFIFFPDPWVTPRKPKNRILTLEFCLQLRILIKERGKLYFKTDNPESFFWSIENLKEAGWYLEYYTEDLQISPYPELNFVTQFESIFRRQNQKILGACVTNLWDS